jgi:hypothetical protein
MNASQQISAVIAQPLPFTPLQDLIATNRLVLRTYAIRSNNFKRDLEARDLPTRIRREYRLARLPRFIWVVEVIDPQLRNGNAPCVVGEAVLDGTSSDHAPEELALHVHGVMWLQQTNGHVRFPILGDAAPYVSGGVGDP